MSRVSRAADLRCGDGGCERADADDDELHHRFPTVPMLVVGKEISYETRISLEKMPDRLMEHPLTALVITNMFYSEAPQLIRACDGTGRGLNWDRCAGRVDGVDFHEQIKAMERRCGSGGRRR